eukprot:2135588-Pyramimonas_sp.AAC.1
MLPRGRRAARTQRPSTLDPHGGGASRASATRCPPAQCPFGGAESGARALARSPSRARDWPGQG